MNPFRASRSLLMGILVAAAYFAMAAVGDRFAALYDGYAPFWPAAGLASGVLVVLGIRYAPAIALASIAGSMLNEHSLHLSIWFGCVDAAEAVIVAWVVRRAAVETALARLSDVARFGGAAAAGAAVNAILNGPVFMQVVPAPGLSIEAVLLGWLAGNTIGHVIVGGLILVWAAPGPPARTVAAGERVSIALATAAVSFIVFLQPHPNAAHWKYLALALVTWTAVRLGQRTVSATLVGLSAIAAWAVVRGTGPFTPLDGPSLQVFLGVCGLAGFGVAAVAAEREDAASLRDREARYRELADASPNLMWTGRSDGTIEFINRRGREYTGCPECPGDMSWMSLVHPEDADTALAAIRAGLTGRHTFTTEQRIKRTDGEYRWHWCVAVPTEDGAPHGPRWIGTATDIHDRKLAELEVNYWRAHYERAQAVGQLGSWESEAPIGNDRLVWSSELYRIFGVTPDGFEGRTGDFYERVHPDDRDRVRRAAAESIAAGSRYSIDHRIVRPDGEIRWVHEEADVTSGADGSRRFVGVCRDITDRVRAEDERRSLEATLLQAQKLESLGILTGGIAHDFNNLLVGILGNASLALLDLPPDAPARRAVERIETSSLRAADLVKQMLAYSGKAALQFERVDVSALVREMGDLLTTAITKKASLRYELSDTLPPVEADPTQLRQIVMNLITNASDAIDDRGGTIRIATGVLDIDRGLATTLLAGFDAAPGPYVRIEVSDSGVGMDRATQSRMFDPFFSTKFAGRGLGLAAVQGIVRSHGGAVRVESAPGAGTSFVVLLPCATGSMARIPGIEPSRAALTNLFSGTALLVDDEDGVRQAIGRMLERFGFSVLQASGGVDGLAMHETHRASIVLVVLDLTMPDMSGADVFVQLRARDATLPVLLASGYGPAEAADPLGADQFSAFLQKPFRPQALADTVATLLKVPTIAR
jgi:PAS domain S-box-containing protein